MTFVEAAQAPLRKYFVFSGRSGRKEFWSFMLVYWMVGIVAYVLTFSLSVPGLYYVFMLGVLVPYWAVAVRRLHDTNNSGFMWLILLIPLVGMLIFIYLLAKAGDPDTNDYGPNPYALDAANYQPQVSAPSSNEWRA